MSLKTNLVGSRVVMYRQTDTMNLILSFHNFASAPKILDVCIL